MNAYFAEFFGTALLILLGNGVVANVCLNKTKGQSSGWIVITTAWAFAVYVAVVVTGPYSGAHLNPAVVGVQRIVTLCVGNGNGSFVVHQCGQALIECIERDEDAFFLILKALGGAEIHTQPSIRCRFSRNH